MTDDDNVDSEAGELNPEKLRQLLESAITATESTASETQEVAARIGSMVERVGGESDVKMGDAARKLRKIVDEISRRINRQLAEIMQHERFLQLEGSWRGLQHLVQKAELGEMVQVQVLHCTKRELQEDFEGGVDDFDLTSLFKLTYESPFELPGGLPYSILIGDYQFDHVTPGDLSCLETLGNVAAASLAPLITSPSSRLFSVESWSEFSEISGLSTSFESAEYVKWRKIRESEASRYIVMAMPRVLARKPYEVIEESRLKYSSEKGSAGVGRLEQASESSDWPESGDVSPHCCWMTSAYLLASRLIATFAETHWFFYLEGLEDGDETEDAGEIKSPPEQSQEEQASVGNSALKFHPEFSLPFDRVQALSKLGFLPLYHDARKERLAIVSSQTLHKSKVYDQDVATETAAIMARLQFVLISSRFCHYIQILSREGLLDCRGVEAVEGRLAGWICQYAYPQERADYGEEMGARYPLEEVKIKVESIPGYPDYYRAKVHLRPWLPKERLKVGCCINTLTLRANS
jgi:type VI secretion system protein ImpC